MVYRRPWLHLQGRNGRTRLTRHYSYNLNVYICYNVIFKELYKFGFGDETLLIVTFKPIDSRLFIVMIDQLNLKNCPTVYKVGLIGIESIAISLVCACAHI